MTHSGDRIEPITVYPHPPLAQTLTEPKLAVVLDWFRANGIDPNGVTSDEQVVISDVVDFWWIAAHLQPDSTWPVLEEQLASGEFPRSHHQVRVTVPLPDQVEAILREVQAQVEASQLAAESALRRAGVLPGSSE